MAWRPRISLAGKFQLLIGLAVVLLLTCALFIVAFRMDQLVKRSSLLRAQDLARSVLTDEIRVGGVLTPAAHVLRPLPDDSHLAITWIDADQFERLAAGDAPLGEAVEVFLTTSEQSWFGQIDDGTRVPFFRYVRAVRRSDLSAIEGGAAAGFVAGVDTSGLIDPIERLLVIQLRDPDASGAATLNLIYLVAAGMFAGLISIGVFWWIVSRLVLSPVRVLRDYAVKVSEGDRNLRAQISTGDEFEQLSDVFNAMLDNIKANELQLRAANKSLDMKLGEMAETNVALYEANKVKGDFLANVSHELRTPLNSIVGFAQVLGETLDQRTGPIDEKRKRYAANIISSGRHLLDLINDLLDLAKIEAGRMEVHDESVSVADTVEGLTTLIKPLADKQRITVVTKIEPKLPMVQTDPGKLQQILFNLLSNAVKFSSADSTVHITAGLDKPVGKNRPSHIRLNVIDAGPGIADDQQERIFDKFTQLDDPVTRQSEGTGLGLAISQELAQLLGARIELSSELGRGATFTLVLPIERAESGRPLMPDMAPTASG